MQAGRDGDPLVIGNEGRKSLRDLARELDIGEYDLLSADDYAQRTMA